MKKILVACMIVCASVVQSQVFQEDFDGNGPGYDAWTIIDVDGNTPANMVSFVTDAWVLIDRGEYYLDGPTASGNFCVGSTSFYTPTGVSNDWLISPLIELPEESVNVIWEARSRDNIYRDAYELRVSTNGGNTIEDFTEVLYINPGENGNWTTRQVSLAAYAGTSIRLAWVNISNDQFMLFVDNILVQEFELETPSCVTLLTPADQSQDLNPSSITFSWEPVEGDEIDHYIFQVGTSPDNIAYTNNFTATTVDLGGFEPGTVYYWSVTPYNANGTPTGCQTFTFRTVGADVTPYCGPISVDYVEPITFVDFAGITNSTSASTEEPSHEAFLDQTASVTPGETYTITLGGNTDGNFSNKFAVFIDWNQNHSLDDAGEIYEVSEYLTNSTGEDGIYVTHSITVPADALPGTTRMRIKKIYHESDFLTDPCVGTGWGQAEDYSIEVGTMSTIDVVVNKAVVYPNPTKGLLHVNGLQIKHAQVFNLLGQTMKATFSENTVEVKTLEPGVYILQLEDLEGRTQTLKFIKQ